MQAFEALDPLVYMWIMDLKAWKEIYDMYKVPKVGTLMGLKVRVDQQLPPNTLLLCKRVKYLPVKGVEDADDE